MPDPLARRGGDGLGGDGRVVEEAVAAVHRPRGVMARRPAQPVGRLGPAVEHEIDRGQRHVHGPARGDVRAGDQRRGAVQAPEAGPATGVLARLAHVSGDGLVAHALEHRAVGVGVGAQERPRDLLRPQLRPGDLQEAHQALVVDGRDGRLAVLGRLGEGEAAVGRQGVADALGPLRDLVGRHAHAHVRLGVDVVGEVDRRVDDLHGAPRLGSNVVSGRVRPTSGWRP